MSERKKVVHIPTADLMITSMCNFNCTYCFEEKKKQINMKFEDFEPFLSAGGTMKMFVFGGEPLINSEFLTDLKRYVNRRSDTPRFVRQKLSESAKVIITNGYLIDKRLDEILENDLILQVSVDGPKHVHDANRVLKNGEGTHEHIMKNITDVCLKHGIKWSMHGVINRKTLKHFKDVSIWHFETIRELKGTGEAIQQMGKNVFQIVFEEEWTDDDVDLLLEQMHETVLYWLKHKELSQEEKHAVIKNFLSRRGGKCGAGWGLLAVDSNFDIFPCHRQADNSDFDVEEMKMTSLYEPENVKNFKTYNTFYYIGVINKFLYGHKYFNNEYRNDPFYWINWCPSTNAFTAGNYNPYYVSSKYIQMFMELSSFIHHIFNYYKIPRDKNGNTR